MRDPIAHAPGHGLASTGNTRLHQFALIVTTAVALASCAAFGIFTAQTQLIGLLLAIIVAVAGLIASDPLLTAVAALPATLLIFRVGGGPGSGLSFSDVVVFCAMPYAYFRVRWDIAWSLRRVIIPALIYEAVALLTVLAHPNVHDSLELVHRFEMVVGALMVGWVIGSSGRARQAMSALLAGSTVLALVTIFYAFKLGFHPSQFGDYQKNYIGAMMWMAIIIAQLNPPWMGVRPWLARTAKYAGFLALLASQSKQSIIALTAAAILAILMQPAIRKRSRGLFVASVPLLIAGYLMLSAEIKTSPTGNTVAIRTESLTSDLHVWLLDPIFGQGMRWFYLPQFSNYFQPPNIVVEALTDTGVIGLLALIVLFVRSTQLFMKMPRSIGTVVIVLIVGRAVESCFDIYWVTAVTTLPWLVAGIACAAADTRLYPELCSRAGSPFNLMDNLSTTSSAHGTDKFNPSTQEDERSPGALTET